MLGGVAKPSVQSKHERRTGVSRHCQLVLPHQIGVCKPGEGASVQLLRARLGFLSVSVSLSGKLNLIIRANQAANVHLVMLAELPHPAAAPAEHRPDGMQGNTVLSWTIPYCEHTDWVRGLFLPRSRSPSCPSLIMDCRTHGASPADTRGPHRLDLYLQTHPCMHRPTRLRSSSRNPRPRRPPWRPGYSSVTQSSSCGHFRFEGVALLPAS